MNKEVQEIVGNGKLTDGDNCSVRHDINKRAKKTQAESFSELFYAGECEKCIENQKSQRQESQWKNGSIAWKDDLKGTCTNSFSEKWHSPECLFYKTKEGCRFGEKCFYAHRQVE